MLAKIGYRKKDISVYAINLFTSPCKRTEFPNIKISHFVYTIHCIVILQNFNITIINAFMYDKEENRKIFL